MADKTRNPRNEQSTLFRKLTRLLSGPLVNYRQQYPHRPTRRQLSNRKIRSASGQQFKKSEYNPYDSIQANYMASQNRADRYIDFDQMEFTPEIASAMDIYADEMTTSSDLSPLLHIRCHNEEIKGVLDTLYHKILNIDFNLFGWARSMCKYGDFFLYLDIDDDDGIKHAMGMPPNEIERLEGEDNTNPNYVQFQWNAGGLTLENWQVAHFRILGNDKYSPYGTSVNEPARRIWRQLTLLEDAVMAYRIVRSPERRVFYIDVGNIAPVDVEQYMQKVMTQMKRNQVVDKDTGRVDLRYNPMSIEEDYFIPVRGGTSSRVESLPGGTYTGDIDDVKYLRDKLFSALKIPASYLSRGEGADEDKTTLAQKDIRFARTIQRLQRAIISELEKIGIVHLFTLGYRGNDLLSFKLALNNPSKLAELQELEHWRTRFDVAGAATEGYFSKRWISQNLFNISEEEFVRMQRESFYDKKYEASLEQATEAAAAAGAVGGGGALGDMGAEELGGEELGAEEGGEELTGDVGAPEEEGGEEAGEESMLLAAPGKRDENPGLARKFKKMDGDMANSTPGANSKWYIPVKDDKRDMGGRNKSMKINREMASPGRRNIYKGYEPLSRLAKLSEIKEVMYEQEEKKLFEVNYEIKKLIKDMENMELSKDEIQS
tara:strand:+ start:38810 stop:40786 length:1977 start_codon:yes stop_codon:yes gene_type:complete